MWLAPGRAVARVSPGGAAEQGQAEQGQAEQGQAEQGQAEAKTTAERLASTVCRPTQRAGSGARGARRHGAPVRARERGLVRSTREVPCRAGPQRRGAADVRREWVPCLPGVTTGRRTPAPRFKLTRAQSRKSDETQRRATELSQMVREKLAKMRRMWIVA